ncbi:hypothetical protein HOO54_15405 [Bacillus sp. WMMC1349]|uniref:hypothetical protein n=1 Tax=Bacillus sp. WMMC1349 TaxID=2736254 RepID=UPI001557431F|nr:hypothetical protein [Bacillus sp. WMMC1349]NPC93587.1 hypothetical protein [Bacillus sp. WMMC1349]
MYYDDYDGYSVNYSRVFEGLVGQFHSLPVNLTLPNGRVLPACTRVFIHRVGYTQAGQELVTIVFPFEVGGNCISGSAVVSATQLGVGGGIQTFR